MKRLVALLALCGTVNAEDFSYTTMFDSQSAPATLPGWDTTIGTLDAIEYLITGTVSGSYQTSIPVTDVNLFLLDQIFLNNIQMGVSSTNTPFSFSDPTTTFTIGGNFILDVMITSNFDSFYADSLYLGMMFNPQVTTNPATIVFGGLESYSGSQTITYFDAIAGVPEPSSLTLACLAISLLFIWYGRRKRLTYPFSSR